MLQKSLISDLKWLFVGAIAIVGIYGVFALIAIQCDLAKARKTLDEANIAIFGNDEYVWLGMKKQDSPFKRGLLFTIPLCLVLYHLHNGLNRGIFEVSGGNCWLFLLPEV